MPSNHAIRKGLEQAATLMVSLALLSCGTPGQEFTAGRGSESGTWAGRPIGSPPAPHPALRRAIISRATQEWEYFGRQTVVFKGTEESIPHVGAWEDEDHRYSRRVNRYWRAVDKPRLHGMDCQQPWSAAFMSWVMQASGVPEHQFRAAPAHWIYLSDMIQEAGYPGRYFVPRRVSDYSPKPGDLVCATRGSARAPSTFDSYTSTAALQGMSSHCDLVVAKSDRTLDVIGGNVRNSVSRCTLELDHQGRLKPVPRRPWFLILENRL